MVCAHLYDFPDFDNDALKVGLLKKGQGTKHKDTHHKINMCQICHFTEKALVLGFASVMGMVQMFTSSSFCHEIQAHVHAVYSSVDFYVCFCTTLLPMISTRRQMYVCLHLSKHHTNASVHLYTGTNTHSHTHTHTHTHTEHMQSTHMIKHQTHVHIHSQSTHTTTTLAHTCAHTHTHMNTHTHTHTHTHTPLEIESCTNGRVRGGEKSKIKNNMSCGTQTVPEKW